MAGRVRRRRGQEPALYLDYFDGRGVLRAVLAACTNVPAAARSEGATESEASTKNTVVMRSTGVTSCVPANPPTKSVISSVRVTSEA